MELWRGGKIDPLFSYENGSPRRIPPAVVVGMRKFRPLQQPISLQDLFNSARLRAEKKIELWMHAESLESMKEG